MFLHTHPTPVHNTPIKTNIYRDTIRTLYKTLKREVRDFIKKYIYLDKEKRKKMNLQAQLQYVSNHFLGRSIEFIDDEGNEREGTVTGVFWDHNEDEIVWQLVSYKGVELYYQKDMIGKHQHDVMVGLKMMSTCVN